MGEVPCFAHFLDDAGQMPEPPRVRIGRVYDHGAGEPHEIRVLVDRLWPRGLSKESLHLDRWLRELAPSDELRRWFGHDPKRWAGFQSRYRHELAERTPLLRELAQLTRKGPVVLLYGARDEAHNEAVVLKDVLEEGIAHS